MNAYELADDVKNISNTIEALEWVQKASPLLRQQAGRIAELEKKCKWYDATYRLPTDQQSAELVGVVIEVEETYGHTFKKRKSKVVQWSVDVDIGTPLYTTPQIKELSDDEIDDIESMCSVNEQGRINGREFARAILKKASEK